MSLLEMVLFVVVDVLIALGLLFVLIRVHRSFVRQREAAEAAAADSLGVAAKPTGEILDAALSALAGGSADPAPAAPEKSRKRRRHPVALR